MRYNDYLRHLQIFYKINGFLKMFQMSLTPKKVDKSLKNGLIYI